MIKAYISGMVLGVVAVITALYFVPAVDLSREASIISVTPNGGNSEVFHVNVPMDRIMIGAAGIENPVPEGMRWPDEALLAGTRAELFKLRNSRDTVVGVASRFAARDAELGDVVEWVLHLPARGSVYAKMSAAPTNGGRVGRLRAGTREFGDLLGNISERWIADDSPNATTGTGKIELVTRFVSTQVDDDDFETEPGP